MVLCKLVEHGERTVGDLADDVGLSQSALSQHLAKMRDERLVTFRRESQALWYRIADPRTEVLFATLYQLYCQEDGSDDEDIRNACRRAANDTGRRENGRGHE